MDFCINYRKLLTSAKIHSARLFALERPKEPAMTERRRFFFEKWPLWKGLKRDHWEEMSEIRCVQCKRCLSVENFKVKTGGQLTRMCIKCLSVKKASRERTRCLHKRERQHCRVCDPVGCQYYRVLALASTRTSIPLRYIILWP